MSCSVSRVRQCAFGFVVSVFVLCSVALAQVPRPYGLGYTPSYVPTYNSAAGSPDIPADALDRSAYASTSAWIDDCLVQNKPGKIGPGTYNVTSTDLKQFAPKGLYGYGATKPIFNYTGGTIAENTPGWFYLGKYASFKVRYLEFRNFGDIINLAVESVDRGGGLYQYNESSQYAFQRHTPQGVAIKNSRVGVGLVPDATLFPRTTSSVGPALDIAYAKFYRCHRVYAGYSDSMAHGRVDFHENVLDGTFGALDLMVYNMTEVYIAKNEWFGLDATYYAPLVKSHSYHTLFKLGASRNLDYAVRSQKIFVENNYAHDILDKNTEPNTQNVSSGVFLDIRNATPIAYANTSDPALMTCDISISYNQVVNVINDWGHEDSNAFYGKLRGGLFEGNYVKNCGGAFVSAGAQNGAEGTGMVVKEAEGMSSAPAGSTLAIRGNIFEDMPACPSSISDSSLSVIKIDLDAALNVILIGNEFINCDNAGTSGSSGLIRHFGPIGKVTAWGNFLENCVIASGAHFMAFHSFSSPATGHEVSNNVATYGLDINYTADLALIKFSSTPSGYVTGRNVLDGSSANYVMLSNPAGSGTAPVRTYTLPTIPGGTVSAPSFSPGGGTFSSAQSVTITSTTSGATIRYTTDGSTPTPSVGTVYSAPVNIAATSTLKAIAYKSGMTNSSVTSATYTISSGGLAFQMSGNQVTAEAEHYSSEVVGTAADWVPIVDSAAVGPGTNKALQVLPNTAASAPAPGPGVARVDYRINVPSGSAATFYIHIRSRAATTTQDSCWVSIDGGTATYLQLGATTTGYSWRTSNSSMAIPAGVHTVTIWMREAGYIFDRIVVKNSSSAPTGTGPAESPQS